jgi:hypothetical protein
MPLSSGHGFWDERTSFRSDGVGWRCDSLLPRLVLGFLALDAMFYWQHRLAHSLPMLWRLHRVHHADTENWMSQPGKSIPSSGKRVGYVRPRCDGDRIR